MSEQAEKGEKKKKSHQKKSSQRQLPTPEDTPDLDPNLVGNSSGTSLGQGASQEGAAYSGPRGLVQEIIGDVDASNILEGPQTRKSFLVGGIFYFF